MIKYSTVTILAILVASTLAAPVEDSTAGQEASSTAAPTTTPAAPTTTPAGGQASSAPATDAPAKDNSSTPMSTSQHLNTTSFTCYGRPIGYYADEEHDCKVYHFCLLGEFNGEPVYQRISYLCLNDTIFDQQALDCLAPIKSSTSCKESHNHYELSNKLLRQAIVGTRMHDGSQPDQTNATNPTS